MGAKPGKHARNPSAGGDDSPLAKRSPKSTSTKRSEVASSPEHSSVRRGVDAGGDAGPSDQSQKVDITDDPDSSEKENIFGPSSSASSLKGSGKKFHQEEDRSSPEEARTKPCVENGQQEQEIEESIVASQHSPVRMEQQQQQQQQQPLEPLTPLVINDNQDISIPAQRHGRHHKPQATSTPAANGQFRTPPL
ncbi:hypothetical protein ElyMa_000896700, partial [Elysia marginata]